MNHRSLKVGDRVRYTSPDRGAQNNPDARWIWEGTVESVTWKYFYVRWELANSPVFGGELVEERHDRLSAFLRYSERYDRLTSNISRI